MLMYFLLVLSGKEKKNRCENRICDSRRSRVSVHINIPTRAAINEMKKEMKRKPK